MTSFIKNKRVRKNLPYLNKLKILQYEITKYLINTKQPENEKSSNNSKQNKDSTKRTNKKRNVSI